MENIKTYSGEQILLSSGRLVFNSRSDSIFLTSKQYINLTAGDKVTIDVGNIDSDNEENMFLVNAPRVQFGLDKNGSAEPVVKGEQLDDILTEMMQALADYSDMVTALAISPPLLASASGFLKGRFQEIKLKLDDFKSPTSFTI
jgi:uncharacterized protein (DUF2345 family)